MYPGVYPAAHQGATPTKDPVIGGLTPGGDTLEPAGNRPRLWVIWVSMAAVAAAAVVAYLLMFAPAGDDSAARAAAAEQGIVVVDEPSIRVTEIEGGFRVTREFEADGVVTTDFFDILAASGPLATGDDAGAWDSVPITGATAYLESGDLPRLHVEAGSRFWTVGRGLQDLAYGGAAQDMWPYFATIVSFDPAV